MPSRCLAKRACQEPRQRQTRAQAPVQFATIQKLRAASFTASPSKSSLRPRLTGPSRYPPHRRRKCFSILRLLKKPTKLAPFLTAAPTAPASARRSSPNIFSIPLVFSRRPHVISLIQHTIDFLNKNSYVIYSLSATLFGCC